MCPFLKSPLNVPFSKEVTKNVHNNQYCTQQSEIKTKHILLIGFYQVKNTKSELLVNSFKDAVARIDAPL